MHDKLILLIMRKLAMDDLTLKKVVKLLKISKSESESFMKKLCDKNLVECFQNKKGKICYKLIEDNNFSLILEKVEEIELMLRFKKVL